MRATGPLFQFDPGWLFVIAGLTVCAAGVLLPAQADLRALESQLAQLQAEEARAYQRLAAHADFIDQVDRGDPAIIKRLAAAQLNLVPEGDTPLLLSSADASPVTDWIDATVKLDIRPVRMAGRSTLSQWTGGPQRLWLFGAGIMAVFIGLLISPGGSRKRQAHAGSPTSASAFDDGDWTVDTEASVAGYSSEACVIAQRQRAPVTIWIDQDGPEPIALHAPASDIDSAVPATLDLEEHEVSQIADTVDLDPDELITTPPQDRRTVIVDDADEDAAEAKQHEAARTLTLQACEIEPHADGSTPDGNDQADLVIDVMDAREGLGAGPNDVENEALADDASDPDADYAGTGLLDMAESSNESVDSRDGDGDGDGDRGDVASDRLSDDNASTAAGDRQEPAGTLGTVPEVTAHAENASTPAAAEAAESHAASDVSPSGDNDSGSKPRETGSRRRPRRTRKRRPTPDVTANETEATPVDDTSSSPQNESAVADEHQPQRDEDAMDLVVIAEQEAVDESDSAAEHTGDDDDLDVDDDDAASIPFLRHRRQRSRK